MQHIGLRCETENRALVSQFQTSGIDTRILALATDDTVCLRFIDPYGDTVFNQLQLPILIEEFEAIAAKAIDKDMKQHVAEILAFLGQAEGEHLYVRFIGD
jgi:hypothetical protein